MPNTQQGLKSARVRDQCNGPTDGWTNEWTNRRTDVIKQLEIELLLRLDYEIYLRKFDSRC